MPEISLNFVRIYRNKETGKYLLESSTLTGDNLTERMKVVMETEAKSWSRDGWQLVSFSHSFLPFKIDHQI